MGKEQGLFFLHQFCFILRFLHLGVSLFWKKKVFILWFQSVVEVVERLNLLWVLFLFVFPGSKLGMITVFGFYMGFQFDGIKAWSV